MPKVQRTRKSRAQTDENARSLRKLSLFLDEAPGFRLGFASYDVPETRERYLNELADAIADRPVHITRLDLSGTSNEECLLDRLRDHLRANPVPEGKHHAVMVVGLEASIDFHTRPPLNAFRGGPILQNANMQRDAYAQLCPVPIVIWLNPWGYRAFAQGAPDLWHWRSGTFSFSGPRDAQRNMQTEVISTRMFKIEDQPEGRKRERIGMLQSLSAELDGESDTPGDRARRAALLLQTGLIHCQLAELPRAIECYSRALELYRAVGDLQGEAYTLLDMGCAYHELGDIQMALSMYKEVEILSHRLGERRFEEKFLFAMGNITVSLNQTARAIVLFDQARAIAQEIGDRHGEGDALANMGNAHYALGQVEQSIHCKEEALAIARELGNRALEAHVLGGLGAIYTGSEQVEKGIGALEQALSITHELGDRRTEAHALANLGTTYAMLGSPARASEFFARSLETAEAIGDPKLTQFVRAHQARLARSVAPSTDGSGGTKTSRSIAATS
jgi:tetratricopeptide (TPR) repeat protein